MRPPLSPLLTQRAVLALLLAVVGGALAALILGEYDFSGSMPYGAGLLLGLVVAELVMEVGHLRSWLVALVTAAIVAGSLGWAAWISSGEGLRAYPKAAWAAMAIGAAASAWRTLGTGRAPPAQSG